VLSWLRNLTLAARRIMSGKPKAWKAKGEGERYIVETRVVNGVHYGRIVHGGPDGEAFQEEAIGTIENHTPYTHWEACIPPQEILDLVSKAPPTFHIWERDLWEKDESGQLRRKAE
jgi:hypothetical protein